MESSQQTLTEQELLALLRELPEWAIDEARLVRFWTFADFPQAMIFVNHVAELAERTHHHPDIDIRYNTVKLALISHDAGGITARDAKMARQLNALPATART